MDGYLRKATEADMDLMFVWANEPSVRKNSFVTNEITYAEHKEWFQKLLTDTDCRQYIYMKDNEAIGQARIMASNETAEIGYSICREKRGQGYGQKLLKLVKEQVKCDFPQVQKLIGKVKPHNIASQKAFANAGFWVEYYTYGISVMESEEMPSSFSETVK